MSLLEILSRSLNPRSSLRERFSNIQAVSKAVCTKSLETGHIPDETNQILNTLMDMALSSEADPNMRVIALRSVRSIIGSLIAGYQCITLPDNQQNAVFLGRDLKSIFKGNPTLFGEKIKSAINDPDRLVLGFIEIAEEASAPDGLRSASLECLSTVLKYFKNLETGYHLPQDLLKRIKTLQRDESSQVAFWALSFDRS
jgi:hypothetical protein